MGAVSPLAKSSYSAKAEYPVRRDLSVLVTAALEYWITRLRG
jgi:hypothetical protein